MERLRILVGGYIGLYPTGGATWDYLQYPLGLHWLGHDVYYVEDTMQYPVFQAEGSSWNDASACVKYLKEVMETFGLSNKWAYRDVASGKCFGLSEEKIVELCKTADVFINISCSTFLRPEYLQIPKRVLIDSDPMFTQMQYALEKEGNVAAENWSTRNMLENHNYLFTFGENMGAADCLIPAHGFTWFTTRQPICLQLWSNKDHSSIKAFTSIMNWSGRGKFYYKNETWGQKDVQFEKYKNIPDRIKEWPFEVVINKPLNKDCYFNAPDLKKLGWKILEPSETVATATDYRQFIFRSGAEFSVAKETYVKANTGWFSCRSACYLAAGKPVITEDTGWSKFIPSGNGLIAFSNNSIAIEAIKEVSANYLAHVQAALVIATEYFDSKIVLSSLLEKIR